MARISGDTKVKMSVGLTLNLGDFQSLRVDVGIEKTSDSPEEFQALRSELKRELETAVEYFEKNTRNLTNRRK